MEQSLKRIVSITFIWPALRKAWGRDSSRGSVWPAMKYRKNIGFGVEIVMKNISKLEVEL